MTRERPILADVAARAGVSVSTASVVFSGVKPVSDGIRVRVLAAATDLAYLGPDPRGRSLRSGLSGVVGVMLEERVMDAFRDPIKIAILDGLSETLGPAGPGILLLPDHAIGRARLDTLAMDALVLIACSPSAGHTIEAARRRGLPVVSVGGAVEDDAVVSVTIDDRVATRTLARHLRDLGHSNVAIATLPLDSERRRGPLTPEREARASSWVALERLRGARDVFPDVSVFVCGASDVDEGLAAGVALLVGVASPPSAIIAQSDLLAEGIIRAAEGLGMRVPGDVSVVGFDGARARGVITHDLTTMIQPAADEGRAGGRAVLAMLRGEVPRSIAFRCTFHPGSTTGRHRDAGIC